LESATSNNKANIKPSFKPFVYLWAKQIGSLSKYERVFSPNVVGATSKPHDVPETTGPDPETGDSTVVIPDASPA
jgi:hypothetical protein